MKTNAASADTQNGRNENFPNFSLKKMERSLNSDGWTFWEDRSRTWKFDECDFFPFNFSALPKRPDF